MAAGFLPKRCRRLQMLVAVCVLALGWCGCSSKDGFNAIREFFDIGPETGAATRPSIQNVLKQSPKAVNQPQGPIVVSHKPFVDGRCRECHEDPSAGKSITIHVETTACLKCHEKLLKSYRVMHGALAARACLWCHLPHESSVASLLRTRDQSLCFQCHERRQLTTATAGHRLDTVICVNCHSGHGGDEVPFLKPSVLNPTTRPREIPDAGE